MPARQLGFDPFMAGRQPIHGGVQVLGGDGFQPQLLGQGTPRRLFPQAARRCQFGSRIENAGDDHRQGQVPFPAWGRGNEGGQSEFLEGMEDGGDMTVGETANDGEAFLSRGDDLTAVEEGFEAVDDGGRPAGEIGEGAFMGFAIGAIGFAEEEATGGVSCGF